MRERFFIIGSIVLLVAALVGLNAASYVQKEKIPDSEAIPHRSTYNTGPTGTRAYHDLLVSTGQKVKRWELPISELAGSDHVDITTFVVVGKTRREITDIEMSQLLDWVDEGGRLVIVDRNPPEGLLRTTAAWSIKTSRPQDAISEREAEVLLATVDPSNSKQMTDGANAAKPVQPTPVTLDVTAVQPSKFASTIVIKKVEEPENSNSPKIVSERTEVGEPLAPPPAPAESVENREVTDSNSTNTADDNSGQASPGPGVGFAVEQGPADNTNALPPNGSDKVESEDNADEIDYSTLAPVILIGNDKRDLLAVFPYGSGSIALLSDPYIISNGGVNLVDNATLGLNLAPAGTIAFDEFHQGYGSDQNRLLSYFTGTPVMPVFLQLCLLIGLLMLSQSRRFARPLPLREPNRLSKLEYVSAMAQLKRRTKAFDLAIENIYTDFRRRISRLAGVENSRSRDRDFAAWIANRTDYEPDKLFELIQRCEDIMHGDPTNKKEVLALTAKIREIEKALGLRRGRNALRK